MWSNRKTDLCEREIDMTKEYTKKQINYGINLRNKILIPIERRNIEEQLGRSISSKEWRYIQQEGIWGAGILVDIGTDIEKLVADWVSDSYGEWEE